MNPDPTNPLDPEALFSAFLDRIEAGDDASFEALLAAHPECADDLRRRHADWQKVASMLWQATPGVPNAGVTAGVVGESTGPTQRGTVTERHLLERWSSAASGSSRYQFRSLVGRGGMGAVLKVWDRDLKRPLAMKLVLGTAEDLATGDTPQIDERTLARFLDEAQITGQLDHPGIVPVHELGTDERGRAYFTMRLVKGQTLESVIEKVHSGQGDWTLLKALGVLLRVCEALAYAHARQVVHRDIKPANVMVGDYGEVYLMDWGLARVLGQRDSHDVRATGGSRNDTVHTVRGELRNEQPDSTLFTKNGDLLGTPVYMSPEQALGELHRVGVRSDVYSVGAILYYLLSGSPPYVSDDTKPDNHAVWSRVKEGPPKNLRILAPNAAAELVTIAQKAMARDPDSRYSDSQQLARELQAYLEGRVVLSHETGTWAEARKWIVRNKALATAWLVALIAFAAGGVGSAILAVNARAEARRADDKTAEANRLSNEAMLRYRDARVLGLGEDITAFERLDDDLAFARDQHDSASKWWLQHARKMLEGEPDSALTGSEWSPGTVDVSLALAPLIRKARWGHKDKSPSTAAEEHLRLMHLAAAADKTSGHAVDNIVTNVTDSGITTALIKDNVWYGIDDLIRVLQPIPSRHGEQCDIEGPLRETEDMAQLRERSTAPAWYDVDELWPAQPWDGIGDAPPHLLTARHLLVKRFCGWPVAELKMGSRQITESVSERGGLGMASTPVVQTPRFPSQRDAARYDHLLAISERLRRIALNVSVLSDTVESLQHRQSWADAVDAVARSSVYGGLKMTPQIGLVPLGPDPSTGLWEFAHLQTGSAPSRGADRRLEIDEGTGLVFVLLPGGRIPVLERSSETGEYSAQIEPFFMSKYEMTHGQWMRGASQQAGAFCTPDSTYPARGVSWNECVEALNTIGAWVTLPTEAQWEFACRANTITKWWPGDSPQELSRAAITYYSRRVAGERELPSRVGSLLANAFGLHDIHGNVDEWCLDLFEVPSPRSFASPAVTDSREVRGLRVVRGGSYLAGEVCARSDFRSACAPDDRNRTHGLRPARPLTP